MRKSILAVGAALAIVSTAAYATVTFNQTTGSGFVGKGDVQSAFGWNNAAAQNNQNGVSFVADASAEFDVTCEWDTVTGGKKSKTIHHKVTNHKSVSANKAVDAKNKVTGQYTGWFLQGYAGGGDLLDFTLPTLGVSAPGICNQGGVPSDNDPPANDAIVTDAYFTSEPAGTLSAVFNNVAKVIANF